MLEQSQHLTIVDRVIGPLYSALYFTTRKSVLGLRMDGLFKNLPWFLGVIAWPLGLGWGWVISCFILAIIVRLLYWQGKRAGYIRFIPEVDLPSPDEAGDLAINRKIELLASGIFSVQKWETYVRQHPAHYWRVGMGDHAVMVKYSANRYLYQFIKPGSMETIVPGILCSGRQPHPALEISFLSDWGPEAPDVSFLFFSPGKEDKPKLLQRKIYLAFDTQETRKLVWNALNNTDGKEKL